MHFLSPSSPPCPPLAGCGGGGGAEDEVVFLLELDLPLFWSTSRVYLLWMRFRWASLDSWMYSLCLALSSFFLCAALSARAFSLSASAGGEGRGGEGRGRGGRGKERGGEIRGYTQDPTDKLSPTQHKCRLLCVRYICMYMHNSSFKERREERGGKETKASKQLSTSRLLITIHTAGYSLHQLMPQTH